ncbi:hypothetical protein [Massilia sp. Dwa41.01b]|uniref:hypothetical protein n=1 Tax=Massilia sp. Dwa41.01b TaxID=2709302 RepID=UPI0035A671E2
MDAQGCAHGLAVQARDARQQLLVDADGQRQAVAESRELLLQLLEQGTRRGRRRRGGFRTGAPAAVSLDDSAGDAVADTSVGSLLAALFGVSAGEGVVASTDSAAGLMVFIDFMVITGIRRIACWPALVRCQSCDFH